MVKDVLGFLSNNDIANIMAKVILDFLNHWKIKDS
jgi:hypothetical protein